MATLHIALHFPWIDDVEKIGTFISLTFGFMYNAAIEKRVIFDDHYQIWDNMPGVLICAQAQVLVLVDHRKSLISFKFVVMNKFIMHCIIIP